MIRFRATVSLCLGLSTALAAMCGSVLPAAAAQGDKAGWQFRIEGEGDSERQFLIYAARDNGARILTFACERDIDTFGFFAEDLGDLGGPLAKATMALAGGPATFNIPGVIEADPETGALSFVAEVPQSNGGQQRLARALAPMLLSGKPLRMTFGAKSRELPAVTGIFDPARRFMRACFGG